jgi:hypothetical protein
MPPKILAIPAVVFALTAATLVVLDRLLLGHVHRDRRTVWAETANGAIDVRYDPTTRRHGPYRNYAGHQGRWQPLPGHGDLDAGIASSEQMASMGW